MRVGESFASFSASVGEKDLTDSLSTMQSHGEAQGARWKFCMFCCNTNDSPNEIESGNTKDDLLFDHVQRLGINELHFEC